VTSLPDDVLFVTHRVPFPPDKGDRIRTYHLLRFLSRHARVHLATLADEPVSPETLTALAGLCVRAEIVPTGRLAMVGGLRSLLVGRTISEGFFRSSRMRDVIRSWSAETGFIGAIASASSVAQYLKTRHLDGATRVIDLVDVDSQKWLDYAAATGAPKKWLYSLEGRRLRKLESSICGWADAVTLVSEREAAMVREVTGATNVHAVTNGVDLDYYRPTPGVHESGCVFVGALDYLPNVGGIRWFAQTIWPNIRLKHAEARLAIVGRKPVAAVKELASIPGVDLIGQVPDVRPYLANAAVAIAPLRIARGLQNKVLEAMSAGKAVVASSPALAGFGSREDLPATVANEPAEWIGAVGRLLDDATERERLGTAGRLYAERHHDWSDCLAPFLKLLRLPSPAIAGGPA
jgi:sugar transferase (PEP-CTERM/EpsH1 system associated)